MGESSGVMSIRDDGEVFDMIHDFKERHKYDEPSVAAREMMKIGYRESKAPILYRLRDFGAYGMFVLIILGVSVMVIGYLTSVITTRQTTLLAMAFFGMAVALLGAVEFFRAVVDAGESATGRVRGLL